MRNFLSIPSSIAMGIIILSGTASAAESLPEIRPLIKAEKPIGTGQLSRLWIVGYDASLWTDAPSWSYDAPFALSITYRMNFSSDELAERSIEEMNGQRSNPDAASYNAVLHQCFPSVKENDRITAMFIPPATLKISHNGTPTCTQNDATFATRFLDIWLSEKTSEPSLRRKLLGL